jgi:hypothetical protein
LIARYQKRSGTKLADRHNHGEGNGGFDHSANDSEFNVPPSLGLVRASGGSGFVV